MHAIEIFGHIVGCVAVAFSLLAVGVEIWRFLVPKDY